MQKLLILIILVLMPFVGFSYVAASRNFDVSEYPEHSYYQPNKPYNDETIDNFNLFSQTL